MNDYHTIKLMESIILIKLIPDAAIFFAATANVSLVDSLQDN